MCEKPLGRNAAEVGSHGRRPWKRPACANMVWYNYRRVPAVTLAKQLIDEGRLGRIFHYRAKFLQDWTISTDLPQGGEGLWRLDVSGRRQRRDRRSAGALHRHRDVAERRHRRSHRDDRDLHQEPQAQPHRQGGAGRHRRCQRSSWRASRTARSRPSKPRATPAATRRSTRSRSTARTRPSCWDLHDLHRLQYFDHRDEGRAARLAQHPHHRRRPSLHEALVGARPADRLRAHLHPPGRRFPLGGRRRQERGADVPRRAAHRLRHRCRARNRRRNRSWVKVGEPQEAR